MQKQVKNTPWKAVETCPYCHEPTVLLVHYPKPLGSVRMPIECRCQREQRELEERIFAEEQRRIAQDRSKAWLPKLYRNASLEDAPKEKAYIASRAYLQRLNVLLKEGQGVFLFGPVGSGKTHLAAALANALICENVTVGWINATELTQLESTVDMDKLRRCRVVVLDDFGVERKTPYAEERLYNFVNERYEKCLPLIVTTNLSPKRLKEMPTSDTNERTISRILSTTIAIEVAGKKQREERKKSIGRILSTQIGGRA